MLARSRSRLHILLASGILAGAPIAAQAQQSLAPRTPAPDVAAPSRAQVGPTMDAATVAARVPVTHETRAPNAAPRRAGYGQPVALMVVGGAALLTGLIISGGAGTAIAVGGAVVGLYGLYQFLQ